MLKMVRIYFDSIKKGALRGRIPLTTMIVGLFLFLSMVGAITPTGYSGDMVCAGTLIDPCYAYMNFTANEDIFIYPTDYDPWSRNTSFDFEQEVESWTLQRSWGTGWRNIPLNKSCTGTWCGLSNVDDTRKFSVAFRKGKDYNIRITAYKDSPYDDIKWSAFEDIIDPTWNKIKIPYISKLKNNALIDELRTTNTVRKISDIDTYKSYDSQERKLLIEDKNYKKVLEMKLTSPYTNYVGYGESVKVAEFLLIDYKKGVDIFDDINFFDKNNDYTTQERVYTLKYGTDYIVEECQLLPDLEKEVEYCQNVTRTNWTEFNFVSELPHKNIKIGMFTDTTLGDKVEWVPYIKGFDILEWAAWDVTAGTKHEFDANEGNYNSLVQIDSTHYLNAYQGLNTDGYAVVLEVNIGTGTVTNISSLEFDTVLGRWHSLVQIDSTRYLNAYQGGNYDGYAVVLTVNTETWAITKGTALNFDADNGHNSLVQIDSTHYLNTYQGLDSDGYAVVLTVSGTTVTKGTALEFYTLDTVWNSLVQIDDTHYLNTYQGNLASQVVVLEVSGDSVTNLSTYEFNSDISANYNSLVQIDSTHYLNTYQGEGGDGYAVVLTVNQTDWTITNGTKHEFDTDNCLWNSLVQIDSTHYLNTYQGEGGDGYAVVLTVNQTDWTITSETKHEFDTDNCLWNSLVQIDSTHYLNAYAGEGGDGYAIVLTVDIPSTDTCTCAGLNTDWDVTISDNCTITSDCDLGTGTLSITGDDGIFTVDAIITAEEIHREPTDFDGGYIIKIISSGQLICSP